MIKILLDDDGDFTLMAFYLGLVLAIILFIYPLKSETEILTNKQITANYIFTAQIQLYSSNRVGASNELCVWLAFNPEFDSILVKKTTYLFYTDRQLIREIKREEISGL